jgi:hypothetical protein
MSCDWIWPQLHPVFSRKIVGWSVELEESQDLAVDMIDAAIAASACPRTRWCCTPTTAAR